MKLSELVAYRNQIDAMSVPTIQRDANNQIDIITHLAETSHIQPGLFPEALKIKQHEINQAFDNYQETLQKLRSEIVKLIEENERHYFSESYRLYEEEEMVFRSNEQIFNRKMILTDATWATMKARVQLYSSWKYPGMLIRPNNEEFIDHMVMFDPLYLVDVNHDLLAPSLEKFSEIYQRRLRPYVVNELSSEPLMKQIPDNQFGICVAFNFFNFRPFEAIRKYLTEIYQKLKPGGVLIMTFNDCDRDKAVMLVEMNYASYTPGTMVKNLAASIGYEKLYEWTDEGPSTWLELKKPGELTSLRGGQTLAKIMRK